MHSHHKIISAILALVVILGLIAFVFTHPQVPRAIVPSNDTVATSTQVQPDDTIVPISKPVTTTKLPVAGIAVGEPYPITVRGTSTCLEFRDQTGPHITSCSMGIKTTEGKFFALKDTDPEYKNTMKFSGEGVFEIKGVMRPISDPVYVSEGIIEVESVTKI